MVKGYKCESEASHYSSISLHIPRSKGVGGGILFPRNLIFFPKSTKETVIILGKKRYSKEGGIIPYL